MDSRLMVHMLWRGRVKKSNSVGINNLIHSFIPSLYATQTLSFEVYVHSSNAKQYLQGLCY